MVLVLLVCASPPLAAAEYFLSPSGSDTSAGTLESPFLTLARGVLALGAGDVLTLRGGMYTTSESVVMSVSGTARKPITLRAYPGETAVVRANTSVPAIVLGASYVQFVDLVFDGDGRGLEGIVASDYGGPRSDHLVVRRCTFRNHLGSALRLVPADQALVEESLFEANGSSTLDHGIYVETGDGIVVRRSLFRDNTGWGIQVYSDSGTLVRSLSGRRGGEGIRISANRVTANGTGGIVVGGEVLDVVVENNLVWNNEGEGIAVDYSDHAPVGTRVRNNTVYGNRGVQIHVGFAQSTTVSNNIVDPGSGAGDVISLTGDGSVSTFVSNLYAATGDRFLIDLEPVSFATWVQLSGEVGGHVASPGLADPDSGDFQLLDGSEAIDVGSAQAGAFASEDIVGVVRPQGAAPDPGAFEYLAALLFANGFESGDLIGWTEVWAAWK